MKTITQLFFALIIVLSITSCSSKQESVQKNATEAVKSVPGVSATVKDGVVTLSGTVPDASMKIAAETYAKQLKDIQSVVNNIVVTPPSTPKSTPITK